MKIPKHYLSGKDQIILAGAAFSFLILNIGFQYFLQPNIASAFAFTSLFAYLFFFGLYVLRSNEAANIYDLDRKRNYRQIEALFNIFSMYTFTYPLPEMRHWAVSPDALVHLLREAIKSEVETVVECGSGVSTIVLAKCFKEKGKGHVYSLDHDAFYADKTKELLALHGLQDFATVVIAPLDEIVLEGKAYKWYSNDVLEKIPSQIDMIFIDGPPAPAGSFNRYPALSALKNKMTKNCIIVMDDVIRSDEMAISKLWAKDLGRNSITYHDVEKKMAII